MEKKNITYLALIGFVAFFLMGMGSAALMVTPGGSQSVTITITGSTTCEPVITECANQFILQNPNVEISVSGTGSGSGIADTISGINDIGMSSRNIKSTENTSAGNDLIDYKFAKDGIAIIIDADHPNAAAIQSTGLTLMEVYMIYNGSYDSWDDINGAWTTDNIKCFTRADDSGTRATFEELVKENNTNGELGDDTAYQTAVTGYQEVGSNSLMVTGVAGSAVPGTEQGIGYCGLGYLDTNVIAVPIDGYDATEANILSEDYPISRSLHMVTNGAVSGWVQAFIDFIFGYYGQQVVEDEGFIRIWN